VVRHVDQRHPHALERGEVAGGLRGSVEVGDVQVEVLVATTVLDVEDALPVPAPLPGGDPPDVVVGDADGVLVPPRRVGGPTR
jgi:hypothetical protein